jgi:hypothetical protein
MSQARTILPSTGLAAFAYVAYAADTGATALLPADSASVFRLSGSAGEFAKMSAATVTGQPFQSALRLEVSRKPGRSQDVQIAAPVARWPRATFSWFRSGCGPPAPGRQQST